MPGPAIIAIPLESGIEIHKSHVSDKTVENGACGVQVEAQIVQKLVKGYPAAPTERQSVPKWSLGPSNWCTFRYIEPRLGWVASAGRRRLLPACSLHFKTTLPDCLNRPAEHFRLCIRSHCSPGLGRFGCAFEITGRLAAMLQTLLRATSLAP